VVKGALVQIIRDVVGVIPNVVSFQYNPEKLSRSLTPWNPFEVDQANRGSRAPTVQPYTPKESFSLVLDLDAADELEAGNPFAGRVGIADRLAALKKLTLPTRGLFGDLVASASALANGSTSSIERPTVPILLFVWGPGRILPVRITSFAVEETLFSPLLFPTQAKVTIALEVLTPDVFRCSEDSLARIAIAAYEANRAREDALAIVNVTNSLTTVASWAGA
jgi:hypothetical protein